jgi:hypothetical protein
MFGLRERKRERKKLQKSMHELSSIFLSFQPKKTINIILISEDE